MSWRRDAVLQARAFLPPNRFYLGRRDAKDGKRREGEGREAGQRARAEGNETKRGKIREGGTLDPLLGCLPHTADPGCCASESPSRRVR